MVACIFGWEFAVWGFPFTLQALVLAGELPFKIKASTMSEILSHY